MESCPTIELFNLFLFCSVFGEPFQEWTIHDCTADSDDSDSDDKPHNQTEVNNLTSILSAGEDDYELPKHWRCAAHTINLIASVDSEKAFSEKNYKKAHRCAFGKAVALWNKQHR